MNTSDLKIDLISRIAQLKDASIIEEIQKFPDQNEYILSESQKERIAEAREEYRNMNYLTEDKANQDIEDQLLSQ